MRENNPGEKCQTAEMLCMKAPFRMNLQLFAEPEMNGGEGEGAGAATAQTAQTAQQSAADNQTFTLDEVMKMVQAEADKRVTAQYVA